MEYSFKNKKVLVTGSSNGIGKEIAKQFLNYGAKVIGVSRGNFHLEGDYTHFEQDLVKNDSSNKIVDFLNNKNLFPLDVVIHNAGGTMNISNPFCGMNEWKKVMRLNFEHIVELNEKILPSMVKNKYGRVVHISSISAMENHGPVTYCSAKAALTAYTRSMGGVVAPDGVVMTAVLPGAVFDKGNFWDEKQKNDPSHVHKYLTERQRIGRFGTTKEIADLVIFLSSEFSSFCTGSIVPIDGGQGRGYFGQ